MHVEKRWHMVAIPFLRYDFAETIHHAIVGGISAPLAGLQLYSGFDDIERVPAVVSLELVSHCSQELT
jgi:hypothetical protein